MSSLSSITISGTAKIIAGNPLPSEYSLGANHPNPFNAVCEIPFALPADSRVRIEIFDIEGREISTVVNGDFSAGMHKAVWNGKDSFGRDVPTGIYLYKMEAGGFAKTRRMLLVK
jgi:hypothetical protein